MSEKFKIIAVDDEGANRRLLKKSLKDKYELLSVASGRECLEAVNDFIPDVFLLDVLMPEMDGFELCRKIKALPQFEHTIIIFLSALDDLDKKLQGYDAGADDYVTKPIDIDLLIAKLNKAQNRADFSNEKSQQAMSLAMTALQNGSEIGIVNHFFERLSECDDYEPLVKHAFNATTQFGVDVVIQLRPSNSKMLTFSSTKTVNPLETELLVQAQNTKRIFSFEQRCLFNFTHSSMLVRKMPDDQDKSGRYRDHLASLMNGLDARIQGINTELQLQTQNESLIIKALEDTHQAIDGISRNFKDHEHDIMQIIQNLLDEMQLAFSYLQLTEEQEEYLLAIFNASMGRITTLFTSSIELDRKFEQVIQDLHNVINHK